MTERGWKKWLNSMYIDDAGNVGLECFLCDAIVVDIREHLRVTHAGNPVAARLLAELEKMDGI